ncbi:hypothetical protein JRG18_11000 [Kocuria palustris]|uniref:HAAS signaling domain-containing protein n=1 Tax=Kocuria palustris TaxID=71999 RepID=UPI0019D23710|nr:hypothetical protein [Kocuria palustris]MBN6754127.1 hypothetical protein [Kocuria palustris]MBN6758990.1 hypothetical protein [Kocuria palustris]MBN6764230.1 hypothetical protein [Kocuria palustris]MBN6783668.1 hypothetical protein [Kocuria palustris]MBN6800148.1 hypothetical protein [Kocuria palustris]
MSTAPDSLADDHDVWQRPFVRMHRGWCDDFVLELRLRDVPGARIGDHLAEVESHCIETGTDPEDAFGDAREYAQEVGDADEPTRDTGVLRVTLISLAALVVFLTGNDATNRWAADEPLSFNALELLSMGLMVAALALIPAILRPVLRRKTVGIAYIVTLLGLGTLNAVSGLLPLTPLIDGIPAAPVSVGSFLILCVLSALEMRELSGGDWVTSPLRAPHDARPPARRSVALIAWIFPIVFVALGALAWIVA